MISQTALEFAAENYGFDPATLERIPRDSGKVMNEVYTFSKDGRKYLLKFEPPSAEHKHPVRETSAAMDFNHYLYERRVSVAAPLKSNDGELVNITIDSNVVYITTAFACLNGRTWGYDGGSAKLSFTWGRVMGDMHRAAKDYVPSNDYDVQKDIFDGYYWGSFFGALKTYPGVYKIAQEVQNEIAALPRDRDAFGVIHGDLHQGNFFVDGDNITIIDFGDSIYGWYALDIAISLCHALWWSRRDGAGHDCTSSIIENFMSGYLSANSLSAYWISKLPLFMKYRHLCMDPEKNGLGCDRERWIYNIENDILFDGFELKRVPQIITRESST